MPTSTKANGRRRVRFFNSFRGLRKALRYAARCKIQIPIRNGHRFIGYVSCTREGRGLLDP